MTINTVAVLGAGTMGAQIALHCANAGIPTLLLDLTPEHLAFHLWYLREKGWIQRLETGLLAITADGVDQVERDRVQLDPERLIESRVPGDSRPDPLHAPAKAPQS